LWGERPRETFTGLAALFPVYLGTLYWRKASGAGALSGITAGVILTALFHLGVLETAFTLPVVFVVSGASIAFIAASLLLPDGSERLVSSHFPFRRLVFPGVIMLLGWGLSLPALPEGLFLHLPWWVWASLALCVAASFSMAGLGLWTPELSGRIVSHPVHGGRDVLCRSSSDAASPGGDNSR